jgi:hypothetical protein
MAVSVLLNNTHKWQSLFYSRYSSQNGSLSVIQNTHKTGVSLLLKILTRTECVCCPNHSQKRGVSATQNTHKNGVSLLPKTLTKTECLCYSKYLQERSVSVTQKPTKTECLCYWQYSHERSVSVAQNTHKNGVSLLLRTLTKQECLFHSLYPCLVFPNEYLYIKRFRVHPVAL